MMAAVRRMVTIVGGLTLGCFVDSEPPANNPDMSSTGAAGSTSSTTSPTDGSTGAGTTEPDSSSTQSGALDDSSSGVETGGDPSCPLQRQYLFLPSFRDDGLVDFPTLVRVDADDIDYAQVAADGSNIHFQSSNGGSELDFEVDVFLAAGGTSVFWVRVPEVSDAQPGFTLCYGGTGGLTPSPGTVWDAGFAAVWHATLGEDPVVLVDSTANGNNGLLTEGGRPPALSVTTAVGSGAAMAGVRHYRLLPPMDVVDAITVEVVMSTDTGFGPDYTTLVRLAGAYDLLASNGGGTGVTLSVTDGAGMTPGAVTATPLPAGTHYLTGTYAARDGIVEACQGELCQTSPPSVAGILATPMVDLEIGRFAGVLDEVRISNVRRDRAWLDATAASLAGNLLDTPPS